MKRSPFKIMARLIILVKPLTLHMLLAITMGLIGHLCASFITVLGAVAVTKITGSPVVLSFAAITAILLIFAFLRGILRYAEQACNHYIAFKLLALIRDKVFTALRRLCPAKLEGKDKGNLISVITSDIELLEVFYAHTVSPVAIFTLFALAVCIFLYSFSPVYSVIAAAAQLTVGIAVPFIISKISGDDGQKFRDKSGNLSSYILDSLRGLNEIIQFGCGTKRLNIMESLSVDISKDEERMKKTAARNTAITNSVILFFDLAILFTGVFLYTKKLVDFSGVLIPTVTLVSSFGPAVALANLGSTLQSTFAAGNRVLDILDEEPVTEEISGKNTIEFEGAKAENVTFSYGNEEILSDFSVTIPKDRIIGISGKSGSGKSTLLKLFMRFWSVQNGSISISGKNVDEINTSNLRDMESFVTQETHLFRDTIKNNIRIAKPQSTDEEIISACKKASVHSFIETLPKGYDTNVGELGDTLSGGEKQRIGLARAFLHDAPFMLLDEPTSNLDSLNEAIILKALKEEGTNKTVVLVSHRKSTMRITDTEYSVEHGRMS